MKKRLLSVATVCSLWSVLYAQTDVTEQYLLNPDFEGNYTVHENPSPDRAIYAPENWNVEWIGGDTNDMSILKGSDLASDSFASFRINDEVTRGNQTYWARLRWGTGQSLVLSQTVTLPAGEYKLSAATCSYCNDNSSNAILFVDDTNVKIETTTQKSDNWKTSEISFKLTEEKEVKIGFSISRGNQVEQIVGIDNFKLLSVSLDAEYNTEKEKFVLLKDGSSAAIALYVDSVLAETDLIEDKAAAVQRLKAEYEKVLSLKSEYNNVKEELNKYQTIVDKTNASTPQDKIEAFNTIINECNSLLDAAITNEEFAAIISTDLNNARNEYIKYAILNDGAELDLTFLVENITYSINGWEHTYDTQNHTHKQSIEKNNGDLSVTSEEGFIENWNPSKFTGGELYYTLKDLPSGIYTISAYTFDSDQSGKVDFFAGDKNVDLDVSTNLFSLSTLTDVQVASDGTLKFGLSVEADATQWIGLSHIQLKKTGEQSNSALFESVQVLLQEAKTLLESLMSSNIENELVSTVANAEALTEDSSVSELDSAKVLLQELIASAKVSISEYESFKLRYDQAKVYTDERIVEYESSVQDTYKALISEIEERYNSGTLGDVSEEVLNVHKALSKAVASQEFTENADYSHVIINNNFETGDLTGWTLPMGASDDTKVVKSENNYTTEGLDGDYFFNTWWQGKPLSQTVENLPSGKYTLGLLYTGEAPETSGFYIVANGKPSDLIKTENSGVFQNVSTVATVGEDGILDIKVQGSTQNGEYSENDVWFWYKADNFTLTPLVSNVELNMSDEWATLILPYDAEVPAGLKVYSCDSVENSVLKMTEVTTIKANVPYIVEGEGNYSFSGANTSIKDSYTAGVLVGVYSETQAPVNTYVLQNQNGEVAFYKVEEGMLSTVMANTVYLQLPAESPESSAQVLYFESEVTGIADAESDSSCKLVDVYNLSGVKVRSSVVKKDALNGLSNGIYIVDGKKIVK